MIWQISLTMTVKKREALERFRSSNNSSGYLKGYSNGDFISRLTKNLNHNAAMIARKYRWAEQLQKVFDFYLKHHKGMQKFSIIIKNMDIEVM